MVPSPVVNLIAKKSTMTPLHSRSPLLRTFATTGLGLPIQGVLNQHAGSAIGLACAPHCRGSASPARHWLVVWRAALSFSDL